MDISSYLFLRMKKGLDAVLNSKKITYPNGKEPISADRNAKLNIILWGDPQISLISPLRSARVYSACQDIKASLNCFDALVLLGDITEYGAKCEYRFVKYLLDEVSDKFSNVFAVSGNHDIRFKLYKKQLKRFADFLNSLENGRANSCEKYYFSQYVNGYKFIMLGSDRTTLEAAYISDRQLNWLDNELEKEKESGKPVFVFNHQPLKKTNGLPVTFLGKGKWRGSVGRESDKLREIFEKYDNVIFITAHLHYCTSKYTYEDCDRFKCISVPTVGVINHGDFDSFSQGYIMSVYDDKIVARSRVFGEGKFSDSSIHNSSFEILLK